MNETPNHYYRPTFESEKDIPKGIGILFNAGQTAGIKHKVPDFFEDRDMIIVGGQEMAVISVDDIIKKIRRYHDVVRRLESDPTSSDEYAINLRALRYIVYDVQQVLRQESLSTAIEQYTLATDDDKSSRKNELEGKLSKVQKVFDLCTDFFQKAQVLVQPEQLQIPEPSVVEFENVFNAYNEQVAASTEPKPDNRLLTMITTKLSQAKDPESFGTTLDFAITNLLDLVRRIPTKMQSEDLLDATQKLQRLLDIYQARLQTKSLFKQQIPAAVAEVQEQIQKAQVALSSNP